tara:strand:- start:1043 stop:1366 length:324 start_codon:yes stop_codon:yes gene_type:complete
MAKQIKQIEYGYWWNCADCGTENAYGLTEAEAEEYIKDFEENNAEEVAEGETGEGACDWNYNVIAEENDAHIEDKEKCWKCDAVAHADTRTDKAKFLDALIDNIVQK